MLKISVIIPCYKCKDTIETTILSLLNQSYPDAEFILVDDGGVETGDLEHFTQLDKRVKVLHIPHGGVCCARNAGLAAATGEYITCCDSDDFAEPKLLEAYAAAISRTDADIVYTDVAIDNGDGASSYQVAPELPTVEAHLKASFAGGGMSGSLWDKCIRRSLIVENQIAFEPGADNWEDWRFCVDCIIHSRRIAKVFDTVDAHYHYILNRGFSLTRGTMKPEKIYPIITNVRGIEKSLREHQLYNAWFETVLNGSKLLAKFQFLQCSSFSGREKNCYWLSTFPEINHFSIIWNLTGEKSKRIYRFRNLLALFHCCWIWETVVFFYRNVKKIYVRK